MALSLQRYTREDMNTGINKLLKQRIDEERERSKLVIMEKIDHNLPESLISEILSWLPVKDLLQFKSVCKAWYSLISSPDFTSKHVKNYYSNNDSWRTCLLVVFDFHTLIELLVDETPRVLDWEDLLSLPARQDGVCGPCDGLFYLYQHDWDERALWNPAINELKTLPEMIRKPGLQLQKVETYTDGPFDLFGFGRDPVTADYKVVVLKTYWKIDDVVSVFVYSLRTNSWKYCGDLTRAYELEFNRCYMYLNGYYFWFGSDKHSTSEVIVSFDMATDEFIDMDVPDYEQPSSKCLAIYNSALAFLSLHETKQILDIWTFTKGSWTKTLTIDPLPHIWIPIGHWKDNLIMVQTKDGKLVLIDPDSKELKELGIQRHFQCQGVFAYMESLVSIKDKSKSQMELGNVEAASKQV